MIAQWMDKNRRAGLRVALLRPVDIAWLVYLRWVFGVVAVAEMARYFDRHRIERYFIEPGFHFRYFGFEWVPRPTSAGFYLLIGGLLVLALFVALGLFYRLAIAAFCIGYACLFLQEQTKYENHLYLFCLLSFLLIWMPAAADGSLDAYRKRASGRASDGRTTTPAFWLYLFRLQLGIVYFYGGLAKLNADWLAGEPMRMWLAREVSTPLIGPFFGWEVTPYLFSYGGLLLDLFIFPALLWKPTRPYAIAAGMMFHLMNAYLFVIGTFPWFMILITGLFVDAGWARRLPFLKAAFLRPPTRPSPRARTVRRHMFGVRLAALYIGLQLLLPLRHWAYPGDVNWTDEGHFFSWRMMLRQRNGHALYSVRHPTTGVVEIVDPAPRLTHFQYAYMATSPQMILQYAHHLARDYEAAWGVRPEVRADVMVSHNGRPAQRLIDSAMDLAAVPRTLRPAPFVLRSPLSPL